MSGKDSDMSASRQAAIDSTMPPDTKISVARKPNLSQKKPADRRPRPLKPEMVPIAVVAMRVAAAASAPGWAMRTASAAGTALEMSARPTEVTKMIQSMNTQNAGLLSISAGW